ncbi:MAG TPA: ABC transporter permease, partial [Chthoniobacterales bacterium]|nr:ABC transporter permease [Chthoniobacterales bacterium]
MSTLRQAFRTVTKAPWLSAIVILSLAIGIGTNTVIFSWLKQEVFEPLPRVTASVWSLETKDDTGGYVSTSWLEYRDLRGMLSSFDGIAAQRPRAFYLGESERDARIYGEFVSDNFFDVLGIRPVLGRAFRPDEASRAGGEPVAIISYEFWQHHFRGDQAVIGRELRINSRTLTVIGVTPPGFRGGMNSLGFDLWIPATMAPELQPATMELSSRTSRPYLMLARLKPGVTRAQAQGELDAAAHRFLEAYPETNKGLRYELIPLWRVPRAGQTIVLSLATLQVFAILILIVVCANTANLLLARATVREREIGVRLAIGAGRGRIVAQLLTESLLLALAGVIGGVLISLWGVDALRQIPLPANLPLKIAPGLDLVSLIFAGLVGMTCGIAFGLAPAWQLAHGEILESLRGGRGSFGGRSRMRDALVGLQVAVALVVLVLAGLFLKSFRNSLITPTGFDQDRVLLGQVDLAGRGYTEEKARVFLDQLLQRLEAAPGVEKASAAALIPLDFRGISTGVIDVEGKEFDPERKILYYNATPGYFTTMGIHFVDGRDLAPMARTDLPLDAVINEEMARRYWPNESPVGRRFEVDKKFYVVSGVVRNGKYVSISEPPQPLAWLTMRAQFIFAPTIYLRASNRDPLALLPILRRAVHDLDPEMAILGPQSLAQHVGNNLFL